MSLLEERTLRTEASTDRENLVEVNLQYKLHETGGMLMDASRRITGSISSGRLVFRSGHRLRANLRLDVVVDWPGRLDDGTGFQVHVEGETQEPEDGCTVVKILRHEFRACAPSAKALDPAGRKGRRRRPLARKIRRESVGGSVAARQRARAGGDEAAGKD
jgi:hypothetical protein